MIRRRGRPRSWFQPRWLLESPLLLAFWSVVLLGAGMAARIVSALGAAHVAQCAVDETWSALVADEAALHLAGGPELPAGTVAVVDTSAGPVDVEVRTNGWRLVPRLPGGGGLPFFCERLPGAAHPSFACALTVGAVGTNAALVPSPMATSAPLPRLLPADAASPLPAGFARDPGIALMHLAAGTDRDDFRLGSSSDVVLPLAGGRAIVVPGNLWIAAGAAPLHLGLAEDLTIVARGNVYIGRSVVVTGPGRLLLVADAPDGTAFVDQDGNGRWSAGDRMCGERPFSGPIEGAGSIWLGLPGGAPVPLDINAGLCAYGPVHLAADAAVGGAVIAVAGVHGVGCERRLQACGDGWFRVCRESVPGFAASGPARPGRLVRSDTVVGDARDAQQPLYLGTPGR